MAIEIEDDIDDHAGSFYGLQCRPGLGLSDNRAERTLHSIALYRRLVGCTQTNQPLPIQISGRAIMELAIDIQCLE